MNKISRMHHTVVGCIFNATGVVVRIRKYVPWWVVVAVFIISLPVRLFAYAVERWRAR